MIAAIPAVAILDAGCGEGYYTAGIYQALMSARTAPPHGGHRYFQSQPPRLRPSESTPSNLPWPPPYHLPLADRSGGCCCSTAFLPWPWRSFAAWCAPAAAFLYVVPAARPPAGSSSRSSTTSPYPNEERETPYDGFTYQTIVPVDGVITLERQSDIHALFQMTPYYWKTPKAGAERLAALEHLTTQISFRIHIFQKR